ncbi:MAG: citrate transporter [Cytophagales bacterium]|nr:MAG: citrate transporter [Cytophagales bacterium]
MDLLLMLPFVTIIFLLSAGPLFFAKWWAKNAKIVPLVLAFIVGAVYVYQSKSLELIETLAEYFSFISIIGALYVVAGGICIHPYRNGTAKVNVVFLMLGALITNIIGTTGASVLLLKPFIRLNRYKIKTYHIIFFIFIISNAAGLITPLGDPPLFMGYLKGVPFFWFTQNLFFPWLFVVSTLCLIFYVFDIKNDKGIEAKIINDKSHEKTIIIGKRNFIGLGIILASLFLDPRKFDWIPTITLGHHHISFLRELIQIVTALVFYKISNPGALEMNEFSLEPIEEVAFAFCGIFVTMMPALESMKHLASSPEIAGYINPSFTFWGTGGMSAILDNAPSFINALTVAMAKYSLDINSYQDVLSFLAMEKSGEIAHYLVAISFASVIFGAFTYVGNGPNFLVKAMAEKEGIKMPSFMQYIYMYALPILLPTIIACWLIFIF